MSRVASSEPLAQLVALRQAWQAVADALVGVETAARARAVLAAHPVAAAVLEVADGCRGGPEVVLTGDLKAGRSTLLNSLRGKEVLKTAVRTCTRQPVSVWTRGLWWTEVPPGQAAGRRRGDGRVVLVDVRQPLPRAVQLAACDGPTVVVCTKADRALEDAVLSEDPAGELVLARRVARRRVAERVGEVAAWIDCDPRDVDAVAAEVWPALQAALSGAWPAVRDRRQQARAGNWQALVTRVHGPSRPPLPERVEVSELAVELCRAELSVCLLALEADLSAVDIRISAAADHAALDALTALLPKLLAAAVLQATRAVTEHRRSRWPGSVARVAERVTAAWCAHLGLPVAASASSDSGAGPDAQGLESQGLGELGFGAPGFGAELPVRQWKAQAAGLESTVGGVWGRAARRLRAVGRRRDELLAGWRALAAELVQVMGDAAWQERWRVEAVLSDVAADQMALTMARLHGTQAEADRVDLGRARVAELLSALPGGGI